MKRYFWLLLLVIGLTACDSRDYDSTFRGVYIGEEVGFNPFEQGDVRLCVDDNMRMYNVGTTPVELVYVTNYVYKVQLIKRLPQQGWADAVEDVSLQYGYAGRILLEDGTYNYCRFFVYNIDYDADAKQFVLFRYQHDWEP